MPITTEQVTAIACDNPKCPGIPAALHADDQAGWVNLTVERYGSSVERHIVCSFACGAAVLGARSAGDLTAVAAPALPVA